MSNKRKVIRAADRYGWEWLYSWAPLSLMSPKQARVFDAIHARFPEARLSRVNEDFMSDESSDLGLGIEIDLNRKGCCVQFYGDGKMTLYDRNLNEVARPENLAALEKDCARL